MPYVPIQEFEKVLFEKAPAQADWLARYRDEIHCGLFPVGIKLHCVATLESLGRSFNDLLQKLGGTKMLEKNYYRLEESSFCLVLPPVGSAEAAITLIETIERAGEVQIFNNPVFQIQVCTPGRLDVERAGILTFGALLGSDQLPRLSPRRVATTFSRGDYISRGIRFTIYDGNGLLERDFGWWRRIARNRDVPHRESRLPFKYKRTDVLTATSKHDIRNINLIATALVHEHISNGYWSELGGAFIHRMKKLIADHQMTFTSVKWICVNEARGEQAQAERDAEDQMYESAMFELYSYIADELDRITKTGARDGIIFDVNAAINALRHGVEQEVKRLDMKKWRPA